MLNKQRLYLIVDGGWREDNFTLCDKSCGGGNKRKQKYCDNPEPFNNGSLCSCDENDFEEIYCTQMYAIIQRECNTQPCPGVANKNYRQLKFHI